MRIEMKFDIPEDRFEFEGAYNGNTFLAALTEMANAFRDKEKYQETDPIMTMEEFYEILNSRGVELYE